MSRRTCLYFNTPHGCRNGVRCTFLHTNPGTSTGPSASPSPSGSRGRSSPNAARHNSSSRMGAGNPPHGACNFYWTSGTCRREFACRFRHVRPSHTDPTEPQTEINPLDALAPYLTADGLARVTGTGTDVFFSSDTSKDISPSEAHNVLKRFLSDDYRFGTTLEIYSFLKPLSSAHTANKSWVTI